MKKNFFKKLSFVMALAMIISVIAPAAGAFAATSASLNSTKKYLYLGQDNMPGEYDFNIKNKPAGSAKFEWTSSNTDVATVESPSGLVTAQAKGTATIKVAIKSKAGKTLKTLSASVIVRDNIDTMKISNFTDKTVVNVGKEFDFDRTFTTFGGSTTATSSITRYAVDSDKATINATNGKFTANEAGEFNVTAYAFLSTYEYTKWLADKAAKWVLTSDTVKVVVAPSIVSTQQTDSDTLKVTFDSDMSKTTLAKDALLYQVINGKQVTTGAEKIKAVSFDTTGKEATVDIFANLTSGATYNFVYGTLVGTFTAASRNLADVKSIEFKDFNADVNATAVGTDLLANVVAYDGNHVAILTGTEINALNSSVLSFAYTGELSKAFVTGTKLFNYTLGYAAPVTVTFDNYVYNDATKKYDEVKLVDTAVGTGTKTDTAIDNASIRYVVNQAGVGSPADDAAWGGSFTVAANDGLFNIHAEYKTKDLSATDPYVKTNDNTVFTYKSSDADKLLVTGATLVPLAKGVVTVIVYNNTNVVGTFEVTITDARTFVGLTQDVASLNVGNAALGTGEVGKIKVTLKDSVNANITSGVAFDLAHKELKNYPAGGNAGANAAKIVITPSGSADSTGAYTLSVTAAGAIPGAYTVKLPVAATVNGTSASKDLYFTLIVGDTLVANTVVKYAVELSDTSLNLKDVISDAGKNVTVDVFGYNAAGYRVVKVSNASYSFDVTYNGTAFADNVTSTVGADQMDVVTAVSGGAISAYATGTYLVKATADVALTTLVGAGNPIGYTTLTLTDSTTKSATLKASTVAQATALNVAGAVAAAFDLKVNDAAATVIKSVTYSDGSAALVTNSGTVVAANLTAGRTLYIDHVVVTVVVGTATMDYTIDVKKTIAVQ